MQRSTWKTVGMTVLVLVISVIAGGLAVVYSGVIDVAATKPHYAVNKWILEETMEHSVQNRAKDITPPVQYGWTRETVEHYGEMCGLCHGAPGKGPSAIGKGLRPDPPELEKVADKMPEGMVLWVVKNGIRMTGMPAFGETHGDKELWEMVAFVKTLPEMSPAEYRRAGGR